MSKIQETAPDIIYLNIGGDTDDDLDFDLDAEVTWCHEPVFDNDIKYIKQSKLSIPKKIAEMLDIAIEGLTKFEDFLWAVDEFDVLIPKDKVEYFRNWTNEEPNAHALAVAYVTGRALGVELVEVKDES